jgi:hypothetical protein
VTNKACADGPKARISPNPARLDGVAIREAPGTDCPVLFGTPAGRVNPGDSVFFRLRMGRQRRWPNAWAAGRGTARGRSSLGHWSARAAASGEERDQAPCASTRLSRERLDRCVASLKVIFRHGARVPALGGRGRGSVCVVVFRSVPARQPRRPRSHSDDTMNTVYKIGAACHHGLWRVWTQRCRIPYGGSRWLQRGR